MKSPGIVRTSGVVIVALLVAGFSVLQSTDAAAGGACGHRSVAGKTKIVFGIKCIVTGGEKNDPSKQTGQVFDLAWLRRHDPYAYQKYVARRTKCRFMSENHEQNTIAYRHFCAAQHQLPPLTEDVVREQFKRLPLPKGSLAFEPSWGALVNKKEIFYTTAKPIRDYPITLLGHHVVLSTKVQTYTWSWGDGSADDQTGVPGGQYPDFDVSHTYRTAAICAVSVSLTYSASYTVDGGAAQPVQGTVTIPGNSVNVRVVTAHAVLVQGGH